MAVLALVLIAAWLLGLGALARFSSHRLGREV
jgi:hypothetical protein